MSKLSGILRRNASLFAFIVIYFIIAATLIILESFQWETQWNILTALLPFFIMGAMLDYITVKNKELSTGYKIFSQLMPTGIFILLGLTFIVKAIGKTPIKSFGYLIWIFPAVPFFITSYIKDNYRKRMFSALLGTGFVGAAYLYLTTVTNKLDNKYGFIVYLVCIFFIFYAASGHRKLYLAGSVLGFIDAAVLIYFRNNPVTEKADLYGWDFDIVYKFELILLANFIICMIICFLSAFYREKRKTA